MQEQSIMTSYKEEFGINVLMLHPENQDFYPLILALVLSLLIINTLIAMLLVNTLSKIAQNQLIRNELN